MLNFKFLKNNAKPGSWRRGYEYHLKNQVLEAELVDNVIKGKVKGNFQDYYTTDIVLGDEGIKAECDCPLEEEWCKHAVSVALKGIEKHLYEEYLTNTTGQEFEFTDENPPELTDYEGGYRFIFNPKRRQKFASIQIIDRAQDKVVTNIESVLRAFIEVQKASNGSFTLNESQKVELALLQELYKIAKYDKKSKFFDFPFQRLEKIFPLLAKAEEVIDSKNKKRLIFSNDAWKLVLTVNVSAVGNVLLSLHWHRPSPEEIYPFEEIRYFSRNLKWARFKNLIFPTSTKTGVLPQYLTKSTFTDIRDADGGQFVYEELPKLKKLMDVEISETLEKLTLEQRPPKNILTMSLDKANGIKASLDFEYDGIKVPYGRLAEKTPYVTIKKPKKDLIYWVKRNIKAEEQAYQMLQACKFAPTQTNNLYLDADSAIDFYNFYKQQAGEHWVFEENNDFSHLTLSKQQLKINAQIDFAADVNSFTVELSCSLGRSNFEMNDVKEQLYKGQKYFYIEDKGNIEVPITKLLLLDKTLQHVDAVKYDEDSYSIKTYRAGVVAELIEQNINLKMSRKFKQFWEQISTFNTLEDIPVPKTIKAELRDYQQRGLNWLWFLYQYGLNGVLADDMGLGKTLQTLALIQKAKSKDGKEPTLVICPTSVVFNWEAEIEKFAPNLKVLNLTGATRSHLFKKIEEHDIVITSYALARRDIVALKKRTYRSVILDESQNIKNFESQTAQAVKQLNSRHKLALSGTPVENRLSELWSVFDFLMPDFLYNLSDFNYKYVTPIMERQDKIAESRLKAQISPFILRRMKRDVAKDLPDKIENVAFCEMTPDQREFYEEVLDSTRQEIFDLASNQGFEKSKMSIFAALLRLRQICCHPRLFDKENVKGINESGKLEHLKEMMEDIISEGHRVLLFSQFTSMLDIIKEWFEKDGIKYEYLTGSTKNRKERVDRFNDDPSIPVFLISLKAGGTGLNLTGADYVIHFDPWWNPAVEDQATDRAYRIGQKKNVFVYRMITKGTVEEKIQKLKSRKRDLVDSIISVDRSVEKSLTFEDIKDILS